MLEVWMKNITLEMLPVQYQRVAKLIGVDNLLKLSQMINGDDLYIPTLDHLTRNVRDELIRKEFNGYNKRELCRKFGLSESSIRLIVKEKGEKIKANPMTNQITFFD